MSLEESLIKATKENKIQLVEDLIKKGAALNVQSEEDQTPLMIAANKGHVEIARKLLKAGALVNKHSAYGHTALSYAISGENRGLKMVQLLVEHGANIHDKVKKVDGFYTMRPLVQAAIYGQTDIAEYLLKQGAKGKEEALPFVKSQKNQKMLNVLTGHKVVKKRDLSSFISHFLKKKQRQKG